ncbi:MULTISPECIES: carbohydrate ABC transporter permease [Clostridia]|uniref:ABC transporter permease n=1 Tax=Lacrimispora celerecrescens TaxID=29354 RepID=A0A084JP26_9FIRM|nr:MULTISPECIES: sugar ABC transporter permease [Clostridia]KEZ90710.1 ABC transporter permease [Lacrimispora celerecrescens]MBW4848024.1 sugar ABC transporter permease [Lachnospiraceae bacterium]MSS09423.1 sugar ABC transporter permease [Clostridium sp. WB02_MRS01]HBG12933.1 sugar ABC transporter permease [Clostridium sp.]
MKRKHSGYAKWGYIFCLPFTIAFLIFTLYPIIFTTVIGFTDCKGLGTVKFHFLVDDPFLNFKNILANPSFQKSFRNTIGMWICNFIPQIGLALLLTAWFTDNRNHIKGKGLFKVLFYMPNIITAATVAILFNALIGYPMGPVNDILMTLGITDQPINFQVNKAVARGSVSFIQFWTWYGYTMIILISGVLGISPEIFESAEVDGASRIQTFFYITIPNLKTILLFTLVTSLIGGLQMFDIPKLFLLGGPDNATLTTSVFIYNQAFSGSYLYNRASAASMIMFIIICAASAVLFFTMRDKDEAELEKLTKQQEREYRKMQKERRKSHE